MLDLLEYVVGASSTAPILIVCLARPDLLETRPSWAAQQHAGLVTLDPLDDDAAQSLVDELLREHELPARLRERVLVSAEGNPLFVEQMLAMLADDPDAGEEAVPATLTALLAARIDRLEPGERTVLQRASVEGRQFHRGSVADLAPPDEASGLGSILLALARKEFVRPDRSLFAGDDGFRFNHVLIRDVAYSSIPKELRAELHGRLASWLEGHADEFGAVDEIVGYHLEQAYEYRVELGRIDPAAEEAGATRRPAARASRSSGARSLRAKRGRLAPRAREPPARGRRLGSMRACFPTWGAHLRDSGAVDEAAAVLTEAIADARSRRRRARGAAGRNRAGQGQFMQERVVTRRFERGCPTRDRYFEGCRRPRPPRGRLAADGDRRARGAGQRCSTPAHCSRHGGTRSNPATCAARSRPGTRSEDQCSSGGRRSPRCSRSSTKSSPGAASTDWRRSRRTRFSAARTSIRGSAASTRAGTSSNGRRRSAASSALPTASPRRMCAGFEIEQLAGDLRSRRAGGSEKRFGSRIEMGASRYVALYRIDLASVLLDQGREAEATAELEAGSRARRLHTALEEQPRACAC